MESASGTASRPESGLSGDDLIPDSALDSEAGDDLEHDAVASVVADLVASVPTAANIALFGPWGSGKSSLFGMVRSRLDQRATDRGSKPRIRFIHYDAWKFGGQSLHRNFLAHVVHELKLPDRDVAAISGATETSRLLLSRFLWRNKLSLLGALILALAMAASWTLIAAWVRYKYGVGNPPPKDFSDALVASLPSGGVAFGLVIGGLLLSNQVLASAVEKRTQAPLQDSDQFFAVFDRLMARVTRKRWVFRGRFWFPDRRVDRLVVFIDELDRCRPEDVAKSLTDLMTFLGHKHCVFVVAADREVLEEALERAPQAKPLRDNEPYYSTSGAFLDKVFQHQVSLPPTRTEALTAYARTAADRRNGFWADLRASDPQSYQDVMYALVPTHVRSPRRVKVLMNNFVTSVRLMNARGMPWRDQLVQVAVLAVLQTEFPSVVRDLLHQPRLLDCLVGDAEASTPELEQLVRRYNPESGEAQEPPTPISADERADDDKRRRVARRLNEQLDAYLGKIRSADVALPGPGLVYAQGAAHADGLADEDLARLLDVAADTAPDTVAQAFQGAGSGDQSAAVRFLVGQLGRNFGQSRLNLVESACRIATSLDEATAREVARGAAGAILNEARTGRWRKGATVGAIRLALLDDINSTPLEPLVARNELVLLAESGGLSELIKFMPAFGDRADLLFPTFGAAYASHPEALHEAFAGLPGPMVVRLWESQRTAVVSWFGEHAVASPIASAAGSAAGQRAAAEPEPELADPAKRYEALLDAVASRENADVSALVAGVASLGIADGQFVGLADVLADHIDAIREAVSDPLDRTLTGLDAIARTVDATTVEAWTKWLDPAAHPDRLNALHACARIATDLAMDGPVENSTALLTTMATASRWLGPSEADDVAATVHESLNTKLPNGTAERRELRSRLRRVLEHLEARHPEPGYVHGYFLKSHLAAVEGGSVTPQAVADLIEEVRLLAPEKAAHLATRAAGSFSANDALSMIRLRIAAGAPASIKVPVRDVLAVLPAPGSPVLRDWADTNPPLKQFETLIKNHDVPAPVLGQYAAQRNIRERSGLWRLLESRGATEDQLRAVGRNGVNATVIDHMKDRILGVAVTEQTKATKTLVTADLSTNTEVKEAAMALTLALLQSGVSGAGPNAVRVVLAARGAPAGGKGTLRKALNDFLRQNPKTRVARGELGTLVDMKLVTPTKANGLTKFFEGARNAISRHP